MNFWHDQTKSTEEIAQDLLGCLLIKETIERICSGWIVETEAYLGEIDEAAHSYSLKKTPRLERSWDYLYLFHAYTPDDEHRCAKDRHPSCHFNSCH
jgi:DNA-3-methyladenine glycosylase